MKASLLVIVTFWFCGSILAQQALPAGTVLPLALNTSLDTSKVRTGQPIKATVMQDVKTGSLQIPARSKVIGSVVEASPARAGHSQLVIRFDTLSIGKRRIALTTDLRAMASMMEVHDAQLPASGPDRGTSDNAWTTTQVGGEVVYRGGGSLSNGLLTVGRPAPNGVLAQTRAPLRSKCRAEAGDNGHEQSLWVFSSDACGLYGMPEISLTHSGRTEPIGQIVLTSAHGNVNLRSGSGLLLRVISSQPGN